MSLIPLVAVVGPTASGKTRLAVDIALRYGGEVVSADSMQIYKGMDVGTAKPSQNEMRGVPHHMIDIIGPREIYSVAQYCKTAHSIIKDINSRGKLPVLAGGTGLYVNSLVDNIKFTKTVRDEKLREELKNIAKKKGGGALLEILKEFDPEAAASLHPNNSGRIIRAIEVYKMTGRTMAQVNEESRNTPRLYNLCMIGLNFSDREKLYRRIDERVDLMMEQGLENEVRALLKSGIGRETTAMQAIGYKEMAKAIADGAGAGDAAQEIKKATRHYAKRQLTWWRRDERINWIEAANSYEKICQTAFEIIDKFAAI